MDADSLFVVIIGILLSGSYISSKISNGIIAEKKKCVKIKKEIQELNKSVEQSRYMLNQKELSINNQLRDFNQIVECKNANLDQREQAINNAYYQLNRFINETHQNFPFLATLLSDWEYETDNRIASELKRKHHPALKASEEVRRISQKNRTLSRQCKEYKHQLDMYEYLFPWLEDFKELPPLEAIKYIANSVDEEDEYSLVKDWLSPEEYSKLSEMEKWQLALDRYVHRKNKTNWHIGIEYERYVGYIYETKGYKVHYVGATRGLEDLGRDILVERENDTLVIQCKRWADHKEIHEKHVMQLFGSVAELNMKENREYKGVLITTSTLSDTAKHFAKLLKIDYVENYKYKSYPMIKCNISQTGEKIYHLPFDQQYDRIHMDLSKGNLYVHTTAEAEKLGFRHAYRWLGSQRK